MYFFTYPWKFTRASRICSLKLVILSMKNNGVNVFTTVIPFIVFMTSPIISKLFSKVSQHQMWEFWKKINCEIVGESKNWSCNFRMSLIPIYIICFLLIQIVEWLLDPHLYKELENLKKTPTYPVIKNVLYICNLLYFRNLWKNI